MKVTNANHNYPATFRRLAADQTYHSTDVSTGLPLTYPVDSYSRSDVRQ